MSLVSSRSCANRKAGYQVCGSKNIVTKRWAKIWATVTICLSFSILYKLKMAQRSYYYGNINLNKKYMINKKEKKWTCEIMESIMAWKIAYSTSNWHGCSHMHTHDSIKSRYYGEGCSKEIRSARDFFLPCCHLFFFLFAKEANLAVIDSFIVQ